MKFKFFHDGGVKFQSFGKTLDESFKNSALALTNNICKRHIKSLKNRKVRVYARNLDKLLSNFLERILVLVEVYDFLISDVKSLRVFGVGNDLRKRRYELEAEFSGDDVENYGVDFDTKRISCADVFVTQKNIKGN